MSVLTVCQGKTYVSGYETKNSQNISKVFEKYQCLSSFTNRKASKLNQKLIHNIKEFFCYIYAKVTLFLIYL